LLSKGFPYHPKYPYQAGREFKQEIQVTTLQFKLSLDPNGTKVLPGVGLLSGARGQPASWVCLFFLASSEGKPLNQAASPRHLPVTSRIQGITLTVFGFHPRVWAAEFGTGVYPLGYQSSLSGYLPAPGFYLRNDFYVYQGNAKIVP
jgi:hypothetical protein